MAMLTQTFSLSNGCAGNERGVRAPSFSSYLNGAEKSCVVNLAKQCKASHDDDNDDDDDDDGEIGVFSADKYFNESLDEEKPIPARVVPCGENFIQPIKSMNESRAMSVRSGSSGNSQSALLNGASKARWRGRGYLGSFRCCSDTNSVAVEENESFGKSLTLSLCVNDHVPKRETSKYLPVDDLPRKSLEVFGLPVLESRVNKPSLPSIFETEKKLRLNCKDEFPKPVQTVIPTTVHAVDTGSDSDASSDLFEIEDFIGKGNPFLSRQVSRNMSASVTLTPQAGYAPSEASIAWSVQTASAADLPITNTKPGSTMMSKKVTATGDKQRRASSSFLTCNNEASIKVVDPAHKTHEKIPGQKIVTSRDIRNQVIKPQTGTVPVKNVRVGISSRSVTVSKSNHGPHMLFLK